MRTRIGQALLAAALAAGSAAAQGKAPDPSDAKTPEDFIRLYAEAEKRTANIDDLDQVIKAMLPWAAEASRGVYEQFGAFVTDMKAFDDAADAKFGKGGQPEGKNATLLVANAKDRPKLKTIEIKGKKDLEKGIVQLTVWETNDVKGKEEMTEKSVFLVKEGGPYKILLPLPMGSRKVAMQERKLPDGKTVTLKVYEDEKPATAEELERVKAAMVKMTAVLKEKTQAVKDGKFKDREAAYADLSKAVRAIRP
jgi:hypothetical protein